MKREWVLALAVTSLAAIIVLAAVRWFAPQLLGIPLDMQMVRVSKEKPSFYTNVFRREDLESREFMIKDPDTNMRPRPLLIDPSNQVGPHDLLGFRNSRIPNIADIVTIGDSQTYGIHATMAENWPSFLEAELGARRPVLYNMSAGGWGAVEYLEMFNYATAFRPRVVVVAFYSGNDPDESVKVAYASGRWAALRPDRELDLTDRPRSPGFPSPPSENWEVRFRGGVTTTFTPALRLISNDTKHATVRAGYQIMEAAARQIDRNAGELGIGVVFTIIPTKELVYAPRVRGEGIHAPVMYDRLAESELRNIEQLAQALRSLSHARYVDVVRPLQTAALGGESLYPNDINGHPVAAGYRVIGRALAPAATAYLATPFCGLARVTIPGNTTETRPVLITHEGVWRFARADLIEANGWNLSRIAPVSLRHVAALPDAGVVRVIHPKRFGPGACSGAVDRH